MVSLHKEFKDFLQLLNGHQVQYLIVGGYAVMFHGSPRPTHDLDVFVGNDPANVEKLEEAIKAFGFPRTGQNKEDFINKRLIVQLDLSPLRIDILNYIDGVDFASAWSNRMQTNAEGIDVFVIGKEELLKNKKSGARAKDFSDIKKMKS